MAIIGSILALGALIYIGYDPDFEVEPDHGGTYVEGIVGGPLAINPLFSLFNDADRDLTALIFNGLTRLNEQGEIIPDLASSWKISDEGKTYTFYLREGVRWHDGVPVSADDIVFTIEAIQDPDFPGSLDLAALWKGVEVKKLDDTTIEFRLAESFAPFLSYTTLGILPTHIFAATPISELNKSPFNSNPIGTGPFRFKEASADQVLLESNKEYFRGQPYLSQVVFRFYHDIPTALMALRQKEIQGLLLHPTEVTSDELANLSTSQRWNIYISPRSSYVMLYLNLTNPLFQDKEVRQALMYSLDRQQIIDGPIQGQGVIAHSPIVPDTWAYNADVKQYDFDPEQASTLLSQAGWTKNQANRWEKEDTVLSFHIFTNDDEFRVKASEKLVNQWSEFGIDVQLSAGGFAGLNRDFLFTHQFDAVLSGWDVGYDPDSYSAWHSSQMEAGFNFASYSNPDADEVLEKARQTSDLSERAELYYQFQQIFAEDVPSILLYYPTYTYLVDTEVKGIDLGVLFDPSLRFTRITDWYIKTKRVQR
jgi:peptide/nickel transport system substrate-binding protein